MSIQQLDLKKILVMVPHLAMSTIHLTVENLLEEYRFNFKRLSMKW